MELPSRRPTFAASVFDRLLCLRLELVIVLAAGLMVFAPRLADPPLIDWDEATYAEVAHEAVTNGQYLTLTWNGEPYLKKPPLLFWMLAASFDAFGESEWSARLPSVLMGLGTLVLIYLAGAGAGRLAGFFAALIPLQFYYFVARGGRECATDAPLLFFSMLAFYALLRAVRNRGWVPVVGVACGLAILSKGPAGLVPLIVAAIAVMILPDFRTIGTGALLLILLEAAVIALPWYILQAISNFSLFWSTIVVHETLLRVVSHLEAEPHGADFTLRTFYREIRYLWPLLMLVPVVALANFLGGIGGASRRSRPSTALWMVWLVVALGAACAVQTKLAWYILPALVPVALLSGAILGDSLTQSGPLRAWRAALALAAIGILASGVPRRWQNITESLQHQRDLSRPGYVMALRAQRLAAAHGAGELFFAGIPLPTLVYYSGMRCHFVSADVKPPELVSANDSLPIGIALHDLVLVDPEGEAVTVSNLDDEWRLNGPDSGK